jgi:hypothetical protein
MDNMSVAKMRPNESSVAVSAEFPLSRKAKHVHTCGRPCKLMRKLQSGELEKDEEKE